jgi:cellulose synthase/poly-beta-1,6-N-acetylglucosamine synthase-like glycosyltransferase
VIGVDLLAPFFWGAAALISYAYAGYPVVLWLLSLGRRPKAVQEDPAQWPTLTLIVAAYNEGTVLHDKLTNSFALDYPEGRLQIVVVSDGSTDNTDEVALSFEGRADYVFLRQPENAGKTMAQNAGVSAATGQLLVFSDANSIYQPDALKQLVRPFAEERVGCVCGELRYVNLQRAGAGKGEGAYWRYEQFLKRRESLLGSLVGANGSIYAMRRELFEPLGPAVISDFIMPIRVRLGGHRVIYEPGAVAHEETGVGFGDEFQRRRRIVARSVYGLWKEPGAFNFFRHPLFTFQILSHKVLRWSVPVLMMYMLLSSLWLAVDGQAPYVELLALQGVFYFCAMLGWAFPRGPGRIGLFYVPAYFCAINYGALRGLLAAFLGQRHSVWKTVER